MKFGFYKVKSKDDIKNILVDDRRGIVKVETRNQQTSAKEMIFKRFIMTGCGRGATFYSAVDVQEENVVDSHTPIAVPEVFTLITTFLHHSQLYKKTGGVHSAALCDTSRILAFADDIGRHNALDKIFGCCLLEDLLVEGRIITSTGEEIPYNTPCMTYQNS